MKKCFFILLLIAITGNTYAHQPDVSTTLLTEQANNQWILQVKAALTAFKYEVSTSYPKETYNSPEEFQALVIRHVMENISVVFDENVEVKFQQPIVKLGHETNVVFEVVGIPEKFSNVKFINSSFKDINRNQSALVILKRGFSQDQFVLNEANNHTAQLKVKDAKFVSATSIKKATMSKPNILLGSVGLVVVGFLLFLKIKQRRDEVSMPLIMNKYPYK